MAQTDSPFLIRCSSCGAPAEFDVRNHIYKCAHCGASTDAKAPLDDLDKWRRTAREARDASLKEHPTVVCTCPNCGASMAVNEGEMSGSCPFCGGIMARRSTEDGDRIPEVVIPFVLTPDEAKKRLDRWLELNPKDRCAAGVRKNRDKLEAVFLPYRLVKGPMICGVRREGAERTFTCGAFVNGSAINASKDMPNDVLDAMEPYDWSEARAFDWGYLSGGQKARFPDADENEMQKRTRDELSAACRPMVEKALMTVGVQVDAKMDEALDMPALLPVYVLRGEFGLRAFVNGQTGRVSVADDSTEWRANRWWLPPLIISAVTLWMAAAFTAASHVFAIYGGSIGQEMLKAATIGMVTGRTLSILFRQTLAWLPLFLVPPVMFFIFRRNRALVLVKHIVSAPRCRAIQTGDAGHRLKFVEGKEAVIQQDTAEVRPVFFEVDLELVKRRRSAVPGTAHDFWTSQGLFPARIRFFPPRRVVRWTIQTSITAFLPAIVNGIGALCGAKVFTPSLLAMTCLWLLLIAPWPLINAARRIGIHVFNKPAVQRIHPDGSLSWVEKGEDESIFLGIKQIFVPFFTLLSKSLNWAFKTSLGTTLGIGVFGFCLMPLLLLLLLFPAFFLISPMSDNTGSGLAQASSKGTSMRLMENLFASSTYLTQQEWDDLPQIDTQEMMFVAAGPLRRLSDENVPKDRREKIKVRLQKTLGEGKHLKLTDSAEKKMDSLDVVIPHSSGSFVEKGQLINEPYSSKLFLSKSNQTLKTFTIGIVDLENKVPDDKLPLVTEFLDNFQRALPLGGFGAMGEGKDLIEFSMGLNVRGMKRVPKSWGELMTFWMLDVTETAERRVRDLISGKTTNVAASEADVKELSDDFWLLAIWDGDKNAMEQGKEPGRFNRVPDLTPEQVIARFDEHLATLDFLKVQKTTALSRTFVYPQLKTKVGVAAPTVTIDASRPKTVLLRAAVKLKTNKAGEDSIRKKLFKANFNAGGIRRAYFDPEEKTLVSEHRLFLNLLKNPPDDLAKNAVIQVLSSMMGSLEKALSKDEPQKAPAEQGK